MKFVRHFFRLGGGGAEHQNHAATLYVDLIIGNLLRIHLTGNSLLLGYFMRRDTNSAVDAHFCLFIQT